MNNEITIELTETRGTYRVLLNGKTVRDHLTTRKLAVECARFVAKNEGGGSIGEKIKVAAVNKGDIIETYGETFRVNAFRDISMSAAPHRHIHFEGIRLSNGSRVGLNLYALDSVRRIL